MEKYSKSNRDRFQLALLRSFPVGVIVNLYISGIIFYAKFPLLLVSPLVGTLLLLLVYLGLWKNKIPTKSAIIISAYIIVAEVVVHTYFLGWDVGFYFFLFLLPLVFLSEVNWKIWTTITFNLTLFGVLFGLVFWLKDAPQPEVFSSSDVAFIAYMNGVVAIVTGVSLIIYSGRVLNKRDALLMSSISDLEKSNVQIAKQNENQKILLKEIHHRVKNNLQIISSLLSLQSRSLEDENLIGVLNESRSRVEAIAAIHMKLYQDEQGGNSVDFKAYLEDFVLNQSVISPKIKFAVNSEELILHLDIAVPLGLIVSELITNAVKHAFEGIETPEVTIELMHINDRIELWVKDNGIGLSDNFDFSSGELGLGADIVVALTDQIDGELNFYNKKGARFKISFQNKALD